MGACGPSDTEQADVHPVQNGAEYDQERGYRKGTLGCAHLGKQEQHRRNQSPDQQFRYE